MTASVKNIRWITLTNRSSGERHLIWLFSGKYSGKNSVMILLQISFRKNKKPTIDDWWKVLITKKKEKKLWNNNKHNLCQLNSFTIRVLIRKNTLFHCIDTLHAYVEWPDIPDLLGNYRFTTWCTDVSIKYLDTVKCPGFQILMVKKSILNFMKNVLSKMITVLN